MKHPSEIYSARASQRKPRFLLPLILLLIASLACSVPGFAGTSATPTQAPSDAKNLEETLAVAAPDGQGGKPQALVDLPPAVVEIDPLPRSMWMPDSAPTFYFNQPMERTSVQAAFQSQPQVSGSFEWLDDSTLRFTPEQQPAPNTRLTLTINNTAKAANGLALAQPVQVMYQTPGPLSLTQRLPEPDAVEINPSSAVVVAFNQPVVALGADSADLPPAFSLQPEAEGRGEWLNTSTYIFYPQPALLGGTTYTVQLDPVLTSSAGQPLEAETLQEWTFSTAAPALILVDPPANEPLLLDADLKLGFNQPMDTASVEQSLSLVDEASRPVGGEFAWNDLNTEVTFSPSSLLDRSTTYTLLLLSSAVSQGGAPLNQDLAARMNTVPALRVAETNPAPGQNLNSGGGFATLSITFSSPLSPNQDWRSLVSLAPEIDNLSFYLPDDGFTLYISGYFAPSTSYTLSVSPDLVDNWGMSLGTWYSYTFSTQQAEPSLVIPLQLFGPSVLFIPQGETGIAADATNIQRVDLSRGSLSIAEFMQAAQSYEGLTDWQSRVQSTWPRLFLVTPNVTETVSLPLTQSGDTLNPGLYFLMVEPGGVGNVPVENSGNERPLLLVVSPLQMSMKLSDRQAFVWVLNNASSTPAADTLVTFYAGDMTLLGTCSTNEEGTCAAELPLREDVFDPVFAVTGQPGDPNFSLISSNWSLGVEPWEFDLLYQTQGGQPEVYLYTDRSIYRPGQTVNFRAVLRSEDNGRYLPTELQQVTVEVLSPYDFINGRSNTLAAFDSPLTSFGTVSGSYTLPENAQPGAYTLRLQGLDRGNISFEVAEYRKPEIDLEVAFVEEDYLAGDDLQAEVSARYFFGAPAGNLPVRWVLYASAGRFAMADNLSAGRLAPFWLEAADLFFPQQRYVIEGRGQTGPDGSFTATISGEELSDVLELNRTITFTLEVTAEDESNLPVSAQAETHMHPADYYIGLRPEAWIGQANEEVHFYVRTEDWHGQPLADAALTARFRKVNWVQDTSEFGQPITRPEYVDAGSTDFRTSERGEARLAFLPAEPGTFLLEITEAGQDADSSRAVTQEMLWVSGPGETSWPNLANQHLSLRRDAERYQPGQSAHIFIPNPLGAGAQALVTVERGRVMRSQVITLDDTSYDLELPLTEEDAPNVYVSVLLVGRVDGQPTFQAGYTELTVDPAAQLLQVAVETSPGQAAPGGDLTLNVRVQDAAGNPVQGEFSLALVDQAVLALADPNAPGIIEAFYGQQPIGVANSLSLAFYANRFVIPPPGRGGGGDGSADQVTAAVRSEYEDTAYWSGTLETDVNGIAQVTVTMPDNLTTWQADVRGLTEETLVGEAVVEVVTSKPLLIRPVAPRFVTLGDHFELSAVVHNNTAEALQAQVSLEAAGFVLDDLTQASQTIELTAGSRQQVGWWGTVQDADALELVFEVNAGNLLDAATPELSPIPVLRASVPQAYGTSGVLAEAGERLEVVSLPRTFTPTAGELRVELAPSLGAAVLDGLEAMQEFPDDFTEPAVSQMLPYLMAYQAFQNFQLQDPEDQAAFRERVETYLTRVEQAQNADGGWGWAQGYTSEPYISAYALFGLSQASQAGLSVNPQMIQQAQDYTLANVSAPTVESESWELDRIAFQYFALQQSGLGGLDFDALYELRDRLSPWGKAFLALGMEGIGPGDVRARTMLSDLQASASRSATGANWQDASPSWHNWSTPNFTTAVVVYAVARLDPASAILGDAVRYLMANRRAEGVWASSYESAWVLLALLETMRGTGDLQPSFDYSALLNGAALAEGRVEGPSNVLEPAAASASLSDLRADTPNALQVLRGEGSGRLYYRAHLVLSRPVEDLPAVDRGISLTRSYYNMLDDCRLEECQPITTASLENAEPVLVRLSLTVPEDMYYVVVEDSIPAGAEIHNPRLNTTQQNFPDLGLEEEEPTLFDLADPFSSGWGWWFFNSPQVFDDHIRWVADYLPAGTYELTYRLVPFLAGEYRLIPAHAWQYYFPEVEGISAGGVLIIE